MAAGLSPMHLLVVFVVALIVLGPDKMPDAMRKGARLLGEARAWSTRMSEELQSVVSLQTQDVLAPTTETPAVLVDSGGLDGTPGEPKRIVPEAPSPEVPLVDGPVTPPAPEVDIAATPLCSLPIGYLPLVPKESS